MELTLNVREEYKPFKTYDFDYLCRELVRQNNITVVYQEKSRIWVSYPDGSVHSLGIADISKIIKRSADKHKEWSEESFRYDQLVINQQPYNRVQLV